MESRTRREFLKASAAAGTLAMTAGLASGARSRRLSTVKVGVVGCGGRGTGAVVQALSADPGAVLWAMGDAFGERIESCLGHVRGSIEESEQGRKLEVPEGRRFVGLDAYRGVIESGVDVVLLTTPPVFRPEQLAAAVAAGKHVFCEKPVAVDAPGVRSVLESARLAQQKGLALMSGFCWRYQSQMREVFGRVLDGGIGEVRAMQCTYNTTGWVEPKPRQAGWSDTEFQLRNWQYFTPFSGDHIVEQAVHAIDWIAWAMGGRMPTQCTAIGGRMTRPEMPETGNVWDNFSATFEFENGARAYHMCRHWPNTPSDNTAYLMGSEGVCRVMPWRGMHVIEGARPWRGKAEANDMYQQEHDELFAAIREGEPINDGELMAYSTLLAIMARQAAYTGQVISWEQILNSQENLNPEPWAWGDRAMPEVAVPGRTRFS